MIARLLRGVGVLLLYFCFATVVAEMIFGAYLAATLKLDRTRVVQILALAQGIDLFEMKEELDADKVEVAPEQVSFDQIREARAVKVRHLELREQSLKDALDQLRFEQRKLAKEMKNFDLVRADFQIELGVEKEKAAGAGMEDVRAKLESLKAAQAKLFLQDMLDKDEMNAVVTLLSGMPNTKAAKIIAEFRTEQETEEIGEVLRRIREGGPPAKLIADTQGQLDQPPPTGP